MAIRHTGLIDQLADSIGKAKAEGALERAADQAGIRLAGKLSEDEAHKLLQAIAEDDKSGTLTTVAANTTRTQLRSMN